MPEPEPWLRGTRTDLDPLRRQVLHSLELVSEDAARFCAPLSDDLINLRPTTGPGAPSSVTFHLRHLARSLDRLLTYAEGRELTLAQHAALTSEHDPMPAAQVLDELDTALAAATTRISAFHPAAFDEPRFVGRQRLPTTLAGLLIHCAEHSQRHIGQAITTAQFVRHQCILIGARKTEVPT